MLTSWNKCHCSLLEIQSILNFCLLLFSIYWQTDAMQEKKQFCLYRTSAMKKYHLSPPFCEVFLCSQFCTFETNYLARCKLVLPPISPRC